MVVRLWGRRDLPFVPMPDLALFELQIRDLPRHLPLLGSYSRFGWRHPGPMETYLVGAVYWLTGKHAISMWIGAALINATACTGIVIVAFRRLGRIGGALATAVLCGYLAYLGPVGLASPWNPIVAILPFLAFAFCLWDAWCGGRWVWLAVIAYGSFAVQAHVQFAAPVVVLTGGVLAVTAWRVRGDLVARCRSALPVIAASGAVFVGLWLLPLYEAARLRGGNLRSIAEYILEGDGQQRSWASSVGVVVREVSAPVAALFTGGGGDVAQVAPRSVPVITVLVLAAIVTGFAVAVRLRRRDLLGLYGLGVIGAALALVQSTRMELELWPYLTAWMSAYAVVFGAAILGSLRALVVTQPGVTEALRRRSVPVALSVLGASALGVTLAASQRPLVLRNDAAVVAPILADLGDRLPRRGPVVIGDGGQLQFDELAALVNSLVRAGIDARVANSQEVYFGTRAIYDEQPVLALQLVSVDPGEQYPELPCMERVAAGGKLALYRPA